MLVSWCVIFIENFSIFEQSDKVDENIPSKYKYLKRHQEFACEDARLLASTSRLKNHEGAWHHLKP